jgi:hypothetical protein
MVNCKKPKWISSSIKEVLKRSLWMTYVSFLSIALFNEFPNAETFLIAFIISIISTIGYHYKFNNSELYNIGIVDHIVYLIIPLIYLFFHYNINVLKYKPTKLTIVALIYILSYKYVDQILYKTGEDM